MNFTFALYSHLFIVLQPPIVYSPTVKDIFIVSEADYFDCRAVSFTEIACIQVQCWYIKVSQSLGNV